MTFYCYVMAAIFSVCCHGQYDLSQRPQEYKDWEKYASELLTGTRSLIVLLSKETRIDRPICWSTKKATNLTVGFHHYLTYFKKDSTGHRKNGTWFERNTMWYVGPINKEPTIGLEASVASGVLDKDVSGDYDLFYANTSCFIMATRPATKDNKLEGNSSLQMLQNNSRCLLWAPEGSTMNMIKDCQRAFWSNCTCFGNHTFRYNETKCENNVTVGKVAPQ
uniref:Lipocalin n=1 Tax=Rhipicephalus zambeziensis TaxID=60191 RepID=A0A224YBC8_9ACAR